MSSFRTILSEWPSFVELTHADGMLCMGSCFAELMGERLSERKFATLVNPSGILYNPYSLAQTLRWMAEGHRFTPDDALERDGVWNSFYHHSRFSALSREALLENVNRSMEAAGHFLMERATRLVLTLGTALVYEHVERGEVVANCHKLPARSFIRRRQTVEEVVGELEGAILGLRRERPELEVILTVSPVRHLREGMVDNQRSKAVLVLAAGELAERLPFVHYFPAYELLLDDLRDYRFYGDDLVHPNALAENYIWDLFSKTYFPEPTRQLVREIESILRAAAHRPFQPESPAHQAFLKQQLARIEGLEQRYPFLSFENERALLSTS